MVKYRPKLPIAIVALLMSGCGPAEDIAVQELPALTRSSVEARLGLPEVRGAWRFAGWELEEGDTLGMDAELPSFGIVWLQAQKRDSLAGFYVTESGRAPLSGEVRRDHVVSLVTYPQQGDGRFLVGEVTGDTLWLEATSLAEPGSWRGDARAAFVRSQNAVTPFRRMRGAIAARPAADSLTVLAGADSITPAGDEPPIRTAAPAAGARPPATTRPGAAIPSAATPTSTPRAEVTQPTAPVTEPPPVEEPEPEPVVERAPPRVIGVPVDRD